MDNSAEEFERVLFAILLSLVHEESKSSKILFTEGALEVINMIANTIRVDTFFVDWLFAVRAKEVDFLVVVLFAVNVSFVLKEGSYKAFVARCTAKMFGVVAYSESIHTLSNHWIPTLSTLNSESVNEVLFAVCVSIFSLHHLPSSCKRILANSTTQVLRMPRHVESHQNFSNNRTSTTGTDGKVLRVNVVLSIRTHFSLHWLQLFKLEL